MEAEPVWVDGRARRSAGHVVQQSIRRSIWFVAVALAVLVLMAGSTRVGAQSAVAPETDTLVVIDARVAHYEDLLAIRKPEVAYVVVDPDRDGIAQVEAALGATRAFAALHIVAHGDPGRLHLGATTIDTDVLTSRGADLARWRFGLRADAEVWLYGCDLAAGAGATFAQRFSDLLEVAVAASTDVTASPALGGDWQLEWTSGRIASRPVFDAEVTDRARVVLALPNGFSDQLVLDNLVQPVGMAVLPSGEMLVIERTGRILLTDPSDNPPVASTYLNLPDTDSGGEKGLLNITLDPDFENNNYFYIYYTSKSADRARISRFVHHGNHAHAGDEVVIWEDDVPASNQIVADHWGGAFGFGPDGYLYLAIGDKKDFPTEAQDPTLVAGKILRLDPAGADIGGAWVQGGHNPHLVPADNPFADGPGGDLDEIWALGLRNPFSGSWDLPTNRFYIGEVGGNVQSGPDASFEDIHRVSSGDGGANLGFPDCEGPACVGPPPPNYSPPIYSIKHPSSRALIVGPVYRGTQFPPKYRGALFFADFSRGWLRYITFNANGQVAANVPVGGFKFADVDNLGSPVALAVGADESLYYLDIVGRNAVGGGQLRRIVFSSNNQPPVITQVAANKTQSTTVPFSVNFSATAHDPEGQPLTYEWDFGNGTTKTGKNVSYNFTQKGSYDVVLRVSDAFKTTTADPLTITAGAVPIPNIAVPADGAFFRAGDVIQLRGNGTDADGPLAHDDFRWTVRFGHDDHFHPFVTDTAGTPCPPAGSSCLSFTVPSSGHDFSDDTEYEIRLDVTDAHGISASQIITIEPDKVDLTFNADVPGGVTFFLDELPRTGPFVHDSLIGFEHTIVAPLSVVAGGQQYSFVSWSNGVTTASQTFTVPASNTVFTAQYVPSGGGGASLPVTLGLVTHLESDQGVGTAGNRVTSWTDLSSKQNDLLAAGNPQYVTGSTPSGQPAISLDGAGDKLERVHATHKIIGVPAMNASRTMIVVAKYDAPSTVGQGGVAYGTGADNRTFGLTVMPQGSLALQGWGGANDLVSTTPGVGAGWLLQTAVLKGGNATLYKDGAQIAGWNHAYNTNRRRLVVGEEIAGRGFVDMDIAALLIYNRALSPAERQQVEAYLTAKYLGAPSGNAPPVVNITAPASGSSFTAGASVGFAGTAQDPEDGNLNAAIAWTSNQDGALATGASFNTNALSVGTHQITATVTDSGGRSDSDSVTVTVAAATGGGGVLPVTTGLVTHLESDQGVGTAGSRVTSWTDLSSKQNDLLAAGNPQYVAGSTPSGQPAISLDGAGDKLERVHATHKITGVPAMNASRTMIVVVKYDAASPVGRAGVAYGTGAKNRAFGLTVTSAGPLVLQGWGGENDLVSTTPGVGAGWLLQTAVLKGGTATLYKDGVQIAGWNHTYNTNRRRLVVGEELKSRGFVDMDIAALLIYNRALGPTERQQVEAYLTAKYLGAPSGNAPPVVNITAPAPGSSFTAGASVGFAGTAQDPEDGNLNAAIAWTSNQDGALATGASFNTNVLSVGTHQVTATVTDSGGRSDSDSVTVTITPPAGNAPPVVTITAPAHGSSFDEGTSIGFAGTAQDPEDGNLSAVIAWTSSLDGALATGASFNTNTLSVGTHQITAMATDTGGTGLSGSDGITVTVSVTGGGDTPPVTAGLVTHLESDQGVGTAGSRVTSWTDFSPQQNHLLAAGNPQHLAGSTPSGQPAISLDGAGDKLERVNATHPISGLPVGNANRTLFVVAKYDAASSPGWGGVAYGTGAKNKAFGFAVSPQGNGPLILQGWGGANDLASTTPGVGAGWLLETAVHQGGNATLYKDGVEIASWNHQYNTAMAKLVVGEEIKGLGFVDMDIAALLIYNRALSPAERQQVEAYLTAKYL